MTPVDVGAHLKVAEEQLRLARDLVTDPEACVRMDVAIQAIYQARSSDKGGAQAAEEGQGKRVGVWPLPIRWSRPRKGQVFEAHLLPDGRVRLSDGRIKSPSGACKASVGRSQWDGWREWRYWDEGAGTWLSIDELRKAGWFDGVLTATVQPGQLTYELDPVLAELWDNEHDAVYDDL